MAVSFCIILRKSLEWRGASHVKLVNVTPILKKDRRLEPQNYKQVSLTTTMLCKLMIQIIRNEIMKHLVETVENFDMVQHERLLLKLKSYGLEVKLLA
jgi:hypothetical protein